MEQISQDDVSYYQEMLGKYISTTCKLENFCHVFLIEHYVKYDHKLTGQFVKDFLSKQDIGFSSVLNTFCRLIKSDKDYTSLRNSEIITKDNAKSIIKFRNIFAHASFNGEVNKGSYEFIWLNSNYEKDLYAFNMTKKNMNDQYLKLAEFTQKVFEIVSPIIQREMEKHGKL